MGAGQCCAAQHDKSNELQYSNGKNQKRQSKQKQQQDRYEAPTEANQTPQRPFKQQKEDNSDEESEKSPVQFKQKKQDQYLDEDDEELVYGSQIENVIKIKSIQKQISFYKNLQKSRFMVLNYIMNRKAGKFLKDKQNLKEEIQKLVLTKFLSHELSIVQRDEQNKFNNFLCSSPYDFTQLLKLTIVFNGEQSPYETDTLQMIQSVHQNTPRYLKSLDLNFLGMKLGSAGCMEMCKAIKKQKCLESLDINLDSGDIGNLGYFQIGKSLDQKAQFLKELKLNLSFNEADYIGLHKLCLGLQNLYNLEKCDLVLTGNKFGEKGAIHLSETLEKLNKIKKLNLNIASSKIGNQASVHLIKNITRMPNITFLYIGLSDCDIDQQGLEELKIQLSQCNSQKFSHLYIGLTDNTQIPEDQFNPVVQKLQQHFQNIIFQLFY